MVGDFCLERGQCQKEVVPLEIGGSNTKQYFTLVLIVILMDEVNF